MPLVETYDVIASDDDVCDFHQKAFLQYGHPGWRSLCRDRARPVLLLAFGTFYGGSL